MNKSENSRRYKCGECGAKGRHSKSGRNNPPICQKCKSKLAAKGELSNMDASLAPKRITLSRKRGFNLQTASLALNGLPAINCARPSKWGNPFRVGDIFCRQKNEPGGGQKSNTPMNASDAVRYFKQFTCRGAAFQMQMHELQGKNLACFCKLDQPCHCDVLLKLANKNL